MGAYVLGLRFNPKQTIPWLETGLEAARRSKDNVIEGALLGALGNDCVTLGDARKAIEYHDQALKISREIGGTGEGIHLVSLGSAYYLANPARLSRYDQALKIFREIGDRRGEGAALNNLGLAYSDLSDPRKVIEYYDQALNIAREIGDRRGEGAALGNLGLAYSDLSDPRKAIGYYDQALKIAREIGDRRNEGNQLGNLGTAYKDLGGSRKAIE